MSEEAQDEQSAPDAPAAEVETRYGVPVTSSRGQAVLHPTRDELLSVVAALAEDDFNFLVDLTAVDYLDNDARDVPATVQRERFELVVGFLSHAKRERIRLRVQVPVDDARVPSLFDVFPGSEALERETFDMFGIGFDDHPDMTRILMPEDWEGHPLRKDYAVGRIPVQFKGAPGAR